MTQSNEATFVAPDVDQDDCVLFLGPLNDQEPPLRDIQPGWTMAHVMHAAGVFPSVGQARKNGWNIPIPAGFERFVVGKRRLEVFTLTRFD